MRKSGARPTKRFSKPKKNLNVELVQGTWERFYRILPRIAEIKGWPSCTQQQGVQYLIEASNLGEPLIEPEPPPPIDLETIEVPLPQRRRERGSKSAAYSD